MSLRLLILTVVMVQPLQNAEFDRLLGTSQPQDFNSISSFLHLEQHPITKVETEDDLYMLIGCISRALFQFSENGTLFDVNGPVTIQYQGARLHLFNITDMSSPFIIAKSIVDVLHKWYEAQIFDRGHHFLGKRFDRRFRDITQLALQLRTFREIYDLNSFQMLSKSLDALDGYFLKFTGSKCKILQRYLYHNEYVGYISDQKLKIVALLGEGASALCFKVQSQFNQRFYALKLFKRTYLGAYTQDECMREESILEKINDINQDIQVPRVIAWTEDGICIYCERHQAILMEYIEKKPKTARATDGIIDSMEMYVQLSATAAVLAINGIFHNDISNNNVIQDVMGKWYLVDFGLARDYERNQSQHDQLPPRLISTWYYYSPAQWTISDLLIDGELWNISKSERMKLILEGSMYQIGSLVLYKVCLEGNLYPKYVNDMQALHDKMDIIYRKQGQGGWDVIKTHLDEIWRVRSLTASKYINQHPYSYFVKVFIPLIRGNDTSAVDVSSDGSDSISMTINTALGSRQYPLSDSQGCCCAHCILS